jgi:ADP-heptose:LPS heptosyltransferase
MLALHERDFDLACSMSPSAKNALLTLLAPAAMRAGYLSGESSLTSFRDELLVESTGLATAPVTVPAGTNLYDRAAKIADLLGCPGVSAPVAQLPASLEAEWPALATSIGLDTHRPFVVIHPFAAWRFREWPLRSLRGLVDLLKGALPDMQVVLLGTAGDVLHALRGVTPLPSGIIVLGTHDWAGSASVISHATAFVGTDSGPLHLASALGSRVVGLFGPAAPKFTAPQHAARKDLFSELPCSPCDQHRCVLPDASCMSRISGRQVFDVLAPFFVRTDAMVANG